jgi:mono/diheme cytochrome c family protein
MRRAALAIVVLGAAAAAVSRPAPKAASEEEGLAAFATVQKVLQHPRCQNCHIPGDAPLQFDAGLPHQQNVLRGSDGQGSPGLPCAACHGAANPPASYGANMPPGAPNWHLPPPERKMVFIGLSAGELCRHLIDKNENGGMSLEALTRHVSEDELVLWGWNPGVGRDPVSVPHAEFVAKFKTWAAAGGPCPADSPSR